MTDVAPVDPMGCIVVTGMPGAGKSTVTRLAAQLLHALRKSAVMT